MENKERNIDYDALIIRFFANEASCEEKDLLESWRRLSSENEAFFQRHAKIWKEVDKASDILSIDVDAEWNILTGKLDNKIELSSKKRTFVFSRIAAVILFFILATVGLYYIVSSSPGERLYATAEPEKFNLPDGSEIILNINAVISYSKKYNKKERNLKLEKGEAFFSVVPNEKKPFIVEVEDIFVRVTGTSFNINTEESNKITVIVESGCVEVFKKGEENDKTILHSGEKCTFDASAKTIDKCLNEDENFNSWRTKKLVFRDRKLSKVVKKLNSTYHSNIVIVTDEISDCRFTSTIENQSLESVLNLIQTALNLEVKQTANSIELSGEGC